MSTETNTIDANTHRPIEGAKDRTEGHLWLQKHVGEWIAEGEMMMPDGSAGKTSGKESVRKLGEYWIVLENTTPMPDDGVDGTMIISIGFDRAQGKFVGSWVGSMMTNLWTYEGQLSGNTLNLESQGPDMMDESKMATYRDAITLNDDGTRTFTSSGKDGEGNWITFMTVRYTRVG